MRHALLCLIGVLSAGPALGQSAYVAGGIGMDVFRTTRVETGLGDAPAGGGEAVAFSVRVGTAVTDRWGVELEVARAGEIAREVQRGLPLPLLTRALPIFESTVRLERRSTTIDAVAWVAQPVGGRVDLVYLGGVAFSRVADELAFQPARRAGVGGIVAPRATRTITYGTGPVAGLEARVRLTRRLMLVPGVRLHGVGGDSGRGWLLRPSASVGWRF